jgi:hypothetical protein
MGFEPDSRQTMYLWSLLVNGGGGLMKDVHVKLSAEQRKGMVAGKLIEQEVRNRAFYHSLSEAGWRWIGEHMDAPLPPRANAIPILQGLLIRLDRYMKATGTPLSAIMTAAAGSDLEPSDRLPAEHEGLAEGIRNAYLRLSGGQLNVRVRIAELRRALAHADRATLDAELRELQRQDVLALYSIDDPLDITADDTAAAVDVAGAKRHIVYLRG